MSLRVAFIGLGVMGQRMLGNMRKHEAFDVRAGWDPDAAACKLTKEKYPDIAIEERAAEIIGKEDTDIVYIACPPIWHRQYVSMAVAAGKTVFCEKPLGVDVEESRAMVEEVEAASVINSVNFPFARGIAADFVHTELSAGALMHIEGVDVRLHFSTWPREWQVNAAEWLSRREQGGFTREVLSHFIFLTERLFGPARLVSSNLHYPDGPEGNTAETHLLAQLFCADIPVTVVGSVGGRGPDLVEYTVWGSRRSYRIFDWNRLKSSDGGPWQEALTHVDDPREDGYRRMLDNYLAQLEGRAHTMPSFREALSVQKLVEAILKE